MILYDGNSANVSIRGWELNVNRFVFFFLPQNADTRWRYRHNKLWRYRFLKHLQKVSKDKRKEQHTVMILNFCKILLKFLFHKDYLQENRKPLYNQEASVQPVQILTVEGWASKSTFRGFIGEEHKLKPSEKLTLLNSCSCKIYM